MKIFERALELIQGKSIIGLGSGRAAHAFVRALGEKVKAGICKVQGVPTSESTATLAREVGIPLISLEEVDQLDVTVDGADEVDPDLNLIKGYGRALVREKIVAASSKELIILVGTEKKVPRLGSRGILPIEVLPFAMPLCLRRLRDLDLDPVPYKENDKLFLTDNGNAILDCGLQPLNNPLQLELAIRSIPGVVGTGLFLGMADTILIGQEGSFELTAERTRAAK